MMDTQLLVILILAVSWGSPIGLGILLMGLGVYSWGKSKAATE